MLRDHLSRLVSHVVSDLIASGNLPSDVRSVPVEISDTKQPEHGDFACNFAMVASKKASMNPRQLGEMLGQAIQQSGNPAIQSVEVAGPGFLNFRLNPTWVASFVSQILEKGEQLPRSSDGGQKINVEFVSVNPNGPITIGSGRGAAYGSTLSNVLEAAGNEIFREYYINDGVNSEQMRQFADSVLAIRAGREVPEKGYKGDYVYEVAKNIEAFSPVFDLDVTTVPLNKIAPEELDEPAPNIVQRFLRWALRTGDHTRDPWMEPITKLCIAIIAQARADGFIHIRIHRGPEGFETYYSNGQQELKALWGPDTLWQPIEEWFLRRTEAIEKDGVRIFGFDQSSERKNGTVLNHLVVAQSQAEGEISLSVLPLRKLLASPLSERVRVLSEELMIARQTNDLRSFGTTFDTWFSEQSLHESGEVALEIEHMTKSGVADDKPVRTKLKLAKGGVIEDVEVEDQTGNVQDEDEDAATQGNQATLWLRSTKFGDDMDRVLRRRDGRLTYIASDVAYHKDKFNRPANADKLITILGPDHHGYIGRLQAVVAAMLIAEGYIKRPESSNQPLDEIEAKIYESAEERDACQAALKMAKEKLEVQIFQLVRFLKDGKPAPMRKRDGNIYALIDLIKEIGEKVAPNGSEEEKLTAGKDVARFFYLMRSHDTTFDFDLDLAEKQSDDNPVFYVQYAHARICSVIKKASEAGLDAGGADVSLLTHERELTLIKKICDLPFEVRRCAEDYGVHRLTTYAIELARTYHHFYDACRVIQPDESKLSKARLALCDSTKVALKSTLTLLGISAPERMDRTEP